MLTSCRVQRTAQLDFLHPSLIILDHTRKKNENKHINIPGLHHKRNDFTTHSSIESFKIKMLYENKCDF